MVERKNTKSSPISDYSIHIQDKCSNIKDNFGDKFGLKLTETDKNRQKQTEMDRNGQKWTQTDRNRQKRTV